MSKLIVISAPSGAGKTSIVHYLLEEIQQISFSVSACSRRKRLHEREGKDYYFLSQEEFRRKIQNNEFLEWQEVYKNQFYGTLKSELDRIWKENKTVIFDLDVVGGINVKNEYPNQCLSIFIMPPSLESLEQRLILRGSESKHEILKRISKSRDEIAKHKQFDHIVINDDFNFACQQVKDLVLKFIN
ncbi:MAG: guanylate kinase [Bacteroidota bacterium]|nr:guanylate kinase [Bacteroidota bacterium]